MSDPSAEFAAKGLAVGTACASVTTPAGIKALYESNETQKLNFAEADKAEGSG
jgi:hypothetical protein